MSVWIDIILGLCVGVFLLVKEVRRTNRRRLALRVVATVFAVASLVGLGWGGMDKKEVRLVAGKPDTAVRSGVTGIDWQRKLTVGERMRLSGRWVGPKVRMVLMGLGGVLDSANVSDKFELGVVPAQRGRAVLTLAAINGGDTLEREDIPVEVGQGRALRVLLLAASPDFENTFLSNWLSGQGDAVASRTAVSKDNYRSGFANMPERPLEVLTPALLGDFDLVIADEQTLTPAIDRQVRERGLGLYVKIDSGSITRGGLRTLVRDSAGKMAVGVVMEGAGKVVYSTANATYAQWMAGRRKDYAAYWSMVLRQLMPKEDTAEVWSWQPALPRVGAPVQATLETEAAMPTGFLNDDVVYLAQDAVMPFRWRGNYWPERSGWLAARTLRNDTTWGYVWPANSWKGIDPVEERVGMKAVVMADVKGLVSGWMYVLFFSCVVFLWIERKMSR